MEAKRGQCLDSGGSHASAPRREGDEQIPGKAHYVPDTLGGTLTDLIIFIPLHRVLCTHCMDEETDAQVKTRPRSPKVTRQPGEQSWDSKWNVSNSRALLTTSHWAGIPGAGRRRSCSPLSPHAWNSGAKRHPSIRPSNKRARCCTRLLEHRNRTWCPPARSSRGEVIPSSPRPHSSSPKTAVCNSNSSLKERLQPSLCQEG